MLKKVKKFVSLVLVLALSFVVCVPAFADTTNREQTAYEKILQDANKEYKLSLGYVPVDTSKVSIEQYRKTTFELAKQQRTLLDYIYQRNKQSSNTSINTLSTSRSSKITKTVKEWCQGYEDLIYIKATYTVTGIHVSYPSSCDLYTTASFDLMGDYLLNISSPKYSKLDSGRTLAVKYTANLFYNAINYKNVTLYAEFAYDA
ncbi:MAG TPA: hypothetical protein DIV41_02935 [Ruminococcaceae bacterium]|nr:hypothetical protein [Oscillospiraceae bacterium]